MMYNNLLSKEELAHLGQLKNWKLTEIFHPNSDLVEVFYFRSDNHPLIEGDGRFQFFAENYQDLCEDIKTRIEERDPNNTERYPDLKNPQIRDRVIKEILNEREALSDLYNQLVAFVKANKPLGIGEEDKNFLRQPSTTACYF